MIKLNNKFRKFFNFLDKYYFFIIGIYFAYTAFQALIYSADQNYRVYCILFAFALLTCYKDIRKDVKWIPFIIIVTPFIIILKYISVHGYDIWHQILIYDWSKGFVIHLNTIFSKIPFNDASFARIYKTETLTWYFRLVYNTGFIYSATIPIYRSALAKDIKKMLRYTFSSHTLQLFLILPFYKVFMLQEVWYVLGQPDGLARVFQSEQEKASWVMHCFPSMHTSVAFAMFLLVLREKNSIFKWVWSVYCLSIIYSTMYLEVHWTLDVLGGLILGYCTVKLVDFLLIKGKKPFERFLNRYYYLNKNIPLKGIQEQTEISVR